MITRCARCGIQKWLLNSLRGVCVYRLPGDGRALELKCNLKDSTLSNEGRSVVGSDLVSIENFLSILMKT